MTNPPDRSSLPGGLPPVALVAIYIALCLTPLALAAAQGAPFASAWRELSSGLAMVAFAMLLVQFLLSGRFRQISGRVGIDITMRFHQLAPWMILVVLLLHPFLYAMPRLQPDPADALAAIQRMFLSDALRSGVAAWLLLIVVTAMAIWRDRLPIRYELWRLSHGLGAALIAGLGAHHTLQVGGYSADTWLAGFWLVLTAVALASLVYVYAIKPLMQWRTPYRVVTNDKVADRMWRVAVEPCNGKAIDFVAGQFVWLNLGHAPFSFTEHPFSISSSPAERPRIDFTIKESGDFTNRIGAVPLGTTAYLDGPHGNFTIAGRQANGIVLIAGGVGFAPIVGILRQLRAERWPHPIVLIYGNRIVEQILYRDELDAMQGDLDLRAQFVLSEPPAGWSGPVGELSPDMLRTCLGPVDPNALYLVCGPTGMMDAVEAALVRFGVPGSRIVSERFKYD